MYYYAASCQQGRHVRTLWPVPVAAWSSEWSVLGVLGRRGRPIISCASWEPRECLGVGVAANVQATVDGLCARPRLGRCRGLYCGGGVSAGTNPKITEALVYSAEALSGRLIMGTALGHSGR